MPGLVLPYTLTNGTLAMGEKVLANFFAIADYLNTVQLDGTVLVNKYVNHTFAGSSYFGKNPLPTNTQFPRLWTHLFGRAWTLLDWRVYGIYATGSLVFELWHDPGTGYVLINSLTVTGGVYEATVVLNGGAGLTVAAGHKVQIRQTSAVYTGLGIMSSCIKAKGVLET